MLTLKSKAEKSAAARREIFAWSLLAWANPGPCAGLHQRSTSPGWSSASSALRIGSGRLLAAPAFTGWFPGGCAGRHAGWMSGEGDRRCAGSGVRHGAAR